MMQHSLLPLIGIAALTLGGCGGKVAHIDHNQLTPMTGSIVEDRSVAIDTEEWVRQYKSDRLRLRGQEITEDDELITKRYDHNRELKSNFVIQDAELALGTRSMLATFEPTLAQGVRAGGGRISAPGASDYVLEAKLTFGPTKAPVYTLAKVGEQLVTGALSMGLASKPRKVRADYTLALTLRDADTGQILREREEKVFHTYAEKHRSNHFSSKFQDKEIAAATGAFVDSIEGQIQAFLK